MSRSVLFLLTVSISILFLVDDYVFPGFPISWVRVFYFVVFGAIYLLCITGWTALFHHFWVSRFHSPIPQLLLTPLAIVSLTGMAQLLSGLFGVIHPALAVEFRLTDYIVILCFAILIETVALIWLFPLYLIRVRVGELPEQVATVTLDGQTIAVKDLLRAVSQEHYLLVKTPNGEKHLRERMKTLLSQVTESDGIQIHRSCWISDPDFVALNKTNVVTQDGEVFAVSRGRLNAVRDWAQQRGRIG